MIELVDDSRWITGSEAATLARISEAALRKRREREAPDRHPRYVSVGKVAVLYPLDEFSRYAATWTNEGMARQATR